jgi:hypothetical protein
MLKKSYITKYKSDIIQPLNSGAFHFTINVTDVWLFGLFETKRKVQMEIPYDRSFKSYFDLWNELIKKKTFINV